MKKPNLALNNLQWLIGHKSQSNQTKPNSEQIFFPEQHHSDVT